MIFDRYAHVFRLPDSFKGLHPLSDILCDACIEVRC
jgi:hypothetical protein